MRVVRAVSLSPDTVEIAYMDDQSDLRADGRVYQVHTLCIYRDESELQDELEAMETAVDALLTAGVRRWSTTMPVSADELEERARAAFSFGEDDDDDRYE